MSVVRRFFAVLLLLVSPSLLADVDPAVEKRIVDGLKQWRPDLSFSHVVQTPIEGLYHVQVINGPVIYVSANGDYLIQGELINVQPGGVATKWREVMLAPYRKELLATADVKDMVVFKAEGATKAVISVFTDIDCGFCRKLHAEMPALNQMGIEVRYLAYPRHGLQSGAAQKLESVWCADDQQQAMNIMKQGGSIEPRSCKGDVMAAHYQLARELGISGTPAVILADGTLISGYRRAGEFKQILGL